MNERLEYLRKKASGLPKTPGIYIMKDKNGKVIYVGKSRSLKDRVSQYFHLSADANLKTVRMVSLVYDFETNEEYKFLENLKNELKHKLSKMNKEELIEYFKSLCPEENLNFEKQINGKTYKVNTYFNEDSEYTILQIIFEILRK